MPLQSEAMIITKLGLGFSSNFFPFSDFTLWDLRDFRGTMFFNFFFLFYTWPTTKTNESVGLKTKA